jgi:hypothetical protein
MSDKPWNEGGKEKHFDHAGITMTHDELVMELDGWHQKIVDAGFVMVPKSWRDKVMKVLSDRSVLNANQGPTDDDR